MKKFKFIAITAIALFAVVAVGQTVVKHIKPVVRNGAGTIRTADTSLNLDTITLGWRCNYKYDLVFEITNTKLTGTVAGTAVLKGTNDSTLPRTKWETITGATDVCSSCKGASMTLSDGTVTGKWHVKRSPFTYYFLECIYTGTATATPTGDMTYGY